MRTLPELIRDTTPYSKENRLKSWWYLFSTLGVITGLYVGIVATDLPFVVKWFLSTILGFTIVRLFIIYHDFRHEAILQKSWLARGILNTYGVLALNPPNIWSRSHNYHHKYNSQIYSASIGSFPIMTKKDYLAADWKTRAKYLAARHPLTIVTGYVTIFILGMCGSSFLKDPRRHWDSLLALIVHAGVLTWVSQYGFEALFLWVLWPLGLACLGGGYLFYIQHNFPDMKLKGREDWDYLFAALRSSSYMTGGPIFHWFTGNIGYHHVHHLNSRIPFYNLPKAMAAVPELQNPGRSSLRLKDIRACLSLKLWDSDLNRMITLRELRAQLEDYSPKNLSENSAAESLRGVRG
jgi:omega-6 fatty acid desaturase (delta-12 desaturase)